MNFKQLKYVLLLSETGSFSRAADILGISQPSLSQYIKNIEKQLGADLFIRSGGEVRLTDAGRVYIDAGQRILDIENQMESRLNDLSDFKSGTVSIGISPYRSVHMMPRVLSEFNRIYPGIKLIVKEKSGKELIESAERGEFDLCVIALPVDETQFEVEPIKNEEILIAASPDSDFAKKLYASACGMPEKGFPAVSIKCAEGEDFATLSDYMPMRAVTDKILSRYGVSVNEKIELTSNEALLSIVSSGICASFIPSGLVDRDNMPCALFSIIEDTAFREVGVIYRKNQYLSTPARELIKIFKAL